MENKEEKQRTEELVTFYNNYNGKPWHGSLQQLFDKILQQQGISRVFVPMELQDNAAEVLYQNPLINRAFSVLLDSFDHLPYRPDYAFDTCWRALNIMQSINELEGDAENRIDAMCCKVATLFVGCPEVKTTIDNLNKSCSVNGISFLLNRLIDPATIPSGQTSLTVDDMSERTTARIQNILGKDFYDSFCQKYYAQHEINGKIGNHEITGNNGDWRKAKMFIHKYCLAGKPVTLDGRSFPPFDTCGVMKLIVGGILYSEIEYRNNGDYYSPLKSDHGRPSHYYEFYYFFTYTYAMFWYLLHCYLFNKEIPSFFTLDDINKCVEKNIETLNKLPNCIGEKEEDDLLKKILNQQ